MTPQTTFAPNRTFPIYQHEVNSKPYVHKATAARIVEAMKALGDDVTPGQVAAYLEVDPKPMHDRLTFQEKLGILSRKKHGTPPTWHYSLATSNDVSTFAARVRKALAVKEMTEQELALYFNLSFKSIRVEVIRQIKYGFLLRDPFGVIKLTGGDYV